MTKADLLKLLADMPDDATIHISTKHNDFKVKNINSSDAKKCIWIDLDYDNDDDGDDK